MDFLVWVGKCVKIDLTNSYYYQGVVTNADINSITLRDKRGNLIVLKDGAILSIREVSNGS